VTSTPAGAVSYRATRLTVEVERIRSDSGSDTNMLCRPFPLRKSRSWHTTSSTIWAWQYPMNC
jgi:hypothetical protein